MALELQRLDDPCPLWRPAGLAPAAPAAQFSPTAAGGPASPLGGGFGGAGGGAGRAYVDPGADGLMIRPVHPEAREERDRLCERFRCRAGGGGNGGREEENAWIVSTRFRPTSDA